MNKNVLLFIYHNNNSDYRLYKSNDLQREGSTKGYGVDEFWDNLRNFIPILGQRECLQGEYRLFDKRFYDKHFLHK